jgi:hypothetical protein
MGRKDPRKSTEKDVYCFTCGKTMTYSEGKAHQRDTQAEGWMHMVTRGGMYGI